MQAVFMLRSRPFFIYLFVILSGIAALSWESLWQIRSSLALGVSAEGTALTLAVTMGGMGLGSFLMGGRLRRKEPENPLRLYGALECMIGIAGLCLGPGFHLAEKLDTYIYSLAPTATSLMHILGIAGVLSVPAICMGATFPVIGLISRRFQIPLVQLYSMNTLGGAAGVLTVAFIVIPALGVTHTGFFNAGLNFAVGLAAFLPIPAAPQAQKPVTKTAASDFHYMLECITRCANALFDGGRASAYKSRPFTTAEKIIIVCATGFTVFALEVAWFRSLTAAFQSTVYAFAIMLATVLIALGQAAGLTKILKNHGFSLGSLLAWAGIAILLATLLIERFDIFMSGGQYKETADLSAASTNVLFAAAHPWLISLLVFFTMFLMTYLVISIPVILLGMGFPWVIEEETTAQHWGSLYALNTVSAIGGSIVAAWVLLPWIGFVRTAWLIGTLVIVVGLIITRDGKRRIVWGLIGCCALLVAVHQNSGVGTLRMPGAYRYVKGGEKVLEFYEGPSSTTSVIEYGNGERRLIIDGTSASTQAGHSGNIVTHYLDWIGSLPMLAHQHPESTLVICFGTGRTANAVRNEGPKSLDIVDIDKNVFRLAHNFPANESVLTDTRVKAIVMDGRAYMRRTDKTYDVITLEPMPPNMAGVNALYSREFYELAHKKLNSGGIIAQWLPYHSVSPYYAASIARTFQSVFPNAILWVDPLDGEGILLGVKDEKTQPGETWPGFLRSKVKRSLSLAQIKDSIKLKQDALSRYGRDGEIITDDNQLLSYGENARALYAPAAR